jgi:uncharacterized membrane protein YqjE
MDAGRNAVGNLGSYTYPEKGGEGSRTLADIFKETLTNVQEIIRSEVQLAKVELKEEVTKAKAAGVMFGAGAALGFFGLGFCLLAIVYALTLIMPAWAAALITGVVLLIVAGGALMAGRASLKKIRMPKKTMFTVKEDVEWMRNQNK